MEYEDRKAGIKYTYGYNDKTNTEEYELIRPDCDCNPSNREVFFFLTYTYTVFNLSTHNNKLVETVGVDEFKFEVVGEKVLASGYVEPAWREYEITFTNDHKYYKAIHLTANAEGNGYSEEITYDYTSNIGGLPAKFEGQNIVDRTSEYRYAVVKWNDSKGTSNKLWTNSIETKEDNQGEYYTYLYRIRDYAPDVDGYEISGAMVGNTRYEEDFDHIHIAADNSTVIEVLWQVKQSEN
jgi:hypothetical protein